MANDILVKVGADISDLSRGLNEASKQFEGLGNMGKSLTKSVTAPLVGLGTASVITGAKFESSMSNVAAVTGATGKDFEALTEQAKEMGRSEERRVGKESREEG